MDKPTDIPAADAPSGEPGRNGKPAKGGQAQPLKIGTAEINKWMFRHYQVPEPRRTEIKESIRKLGVQVPVVLSPLMELADGYLRVELCEELTAEGVPDRDWVPFVVNPGLDSEAKLIAFLFESEKRCDRSPVDLGRYVKKFMADHGLATQKAAAERLGLTEPTLYRALLPFDFEQDVVDAIGNGDISIAHLTAVTPLKDKAREHQLLRDVMAADPKKRPSAAALKKLAFPSPRKESRVHKFVSGKLLVTCPKLASYEEVIEGLEDIKAQLAVRFKATPKAALTVGELKPVEAKPAEPSKAEAKTTEVTVTASFKS